MAWNGNPHRLQDIKKLILNELETPPPAGSLSYVEDAIQSVGARAEMWGDTHVNSHQFQTFPAKGT